MGNEIITFGNIEVEKLKFNQYKNTVAMYDVKIDRIVVYNSIPFSQKGFK